MTSTPTIPPTGVSPGPGSRPSTSVPGRRGFAAVMAMLFLVMFSTLALGIYASATMSSLVSEADRRQMLAQSAAESGLDWARYNLSRVTIPPGTAPTQCIDQLYADLQTQLNGTANLAGGSISRSGNVISIPASGWIALSSDGMQAFRVTITDWAGEIVVKSEGRQGITPQLPVRRAISMDFTRQMRTGSIFDFAVASKGQVVGQSGNITGAPGVDPSVATIMSALDNGTAINISKATFGGNITLLDSATLSVTGGSVAGQTIPSLIAANANRVSEAPEFPLWDPTLYRQYATTNWTDGAKVQANIRIPRNSGTPSKPVTFNANDTVQGIMYIESPNNVKFNGNFKLQGFIVMEQSASTTDSLDFKGNVTQTPVPGGTQFDPLRATSGVAILAPNAAVSMTGSTDSNLRGSVVVNTFNFQGSAKITIDQGTLMAYGGGSNSVLFSSSGSAKTAGVFFTATGENNQPTTGVSYSAYYTPKPQSYQEVTP